MTRSARYDSLALSHTLSLSVRPADEWNVPLQLIDLHGPAPHAHLIRRLIQGASSLLSSSAAGSGSSPASPQSAQASQPPSPELHLRLLASEIQRCARDPTLAERFRDAVLEGSTDGPNGSDSVLRAVSSLSALLSSHPSLNDLSPLERLVFATPFLTLLYPPTSTAPAAPLGLKRALGLDAARIVRQALPGALEQLGAPAKGPRDLAELSPLPISRLLAILLSDLYLGESPPAPNVANPERAFSDEERRAIVLAAVRGRLGPEVGAQALAHAFNEIAFDEQRPPSPIAALVRLAPIPQLSSPELVRSILSKFGGLQAEDAHTGGGGVELRVAQQMFEVVEYASREGEAGRGGGGIDVATWVRAVHELQPSLRWGDVVRGYDSPLRAASLPEHHFGLRAFAAILQNSPSPQPTVEDPLANPVVSPPGLVSNPGGTSAISGLWTPWVNPALQFSLIDRLVYLASSPAPAGPTGVDTSSTASPPFSLSNLASVHRVVSLVDAAQSGPAIKALAQSVQNSPWNAFELIKTLVNLGGEGIQGGANGEVAARVHELLDRGCKANPELVLIALTQVEVRFPLLFLDRDSDSRN